MVGTMSVMLEGPANALDLRKDCSQVPTGTCFLGQSILIWIWILLFHLYADTVLELVLYRMYSRYGDHFRI